MISREEFKNLLGDNGNDLTEERVIELQDNLEQMAQLCFDVWREDKKELQTLEKSLG